MHLLEYIKYIFPEVSPHSTVYWHESGKSLNATKAHSSAFGFGIGFQLNTRSLTCTEKQDVLQNATGMCCDSILHERESEMPSLRPSVRASRCVL